jgi:hypothetical protein
VRHRHVRQEGRALPQDILVDPTQVAFLTQVNQIATTPVQLVNNGTTLPITVSNSRPDLFRIEGMSETELVDDPQRALHMIGNLRLDYDDLRAVKPDIILVSMPSHGKTGPESHHVAYGTNVEQLSGLTSITGYPGMGPHKSPIAYGDPNAGAIAAAAALAALHHRRETGEGQHVEVAQWEAMIGVIGEHILGHQMGEATESLGNRHISRVQGVYECSTPDEWVAISAGSDAEFAALAATIDRPELARDPRFADVVSRRHHHDDLDALIAEWTRGRSQDDAAHAMQDAGVPLDTCGTLVGPSKAAGCASCGANPCQTNGCYGGWWCNTATSRCQAPPTKNAIVPGRDGTGSVVGVTLPTAASPPRKTSEK